LSAGLGSSAMTMPRTIAIVGAGAMGCLFAARLAEAGAAVTLVDVDPARLAMLAGEGITLDDDRGERVVRIAAATVAADVSGPMDLVMLFTKGMHSAAAIRSVAHLAGPDTHALTLQNGLGNAEAMADVFAPDRILIGVTDFPADLQGSARVASHGAGQIWLGALTQGGERAVAPVVDLFNASNLAATADRDVRVAIWEKVAFNAALNPLATVTMLTVGGMNQPAGRAIAFAIVDEVVATAAAEGIAIDRDRIVGKIEHALDHHTHHKASMLQDRLAGRRTEIESINGAIVRIARRHGIATPVTATLADLVRMIDTAR